MQMPGKQLVLLNVVMGLVLILGCGCNQFYYATNNIFHNSKLYLQSREIELKSQHLAKTAWKEYEVIHPEWLNSHDYRDGFITGYADFLVNGGNGTPPAVPPKKYQSTKYLNPDGYQAIDHYFAGFVTGAQEARASGVRETLVVPILAPLIPAPTDDPAGVYTPDPSLKSGSKSMKSDSKPSALLPPPESATKN